MTAHLPPPSAETNSTQPSGLIHWLICKNLLNLDKKITFTGHILLTGCLLFFVIISYSVMFIVADRWAGEWLNCSPQPLQQSQLFEKQNAEENRIQRRLTQQHNAINDLTAKHCRIMAFFYKQYYISLSIGSTAALVAFLCIFFLSKEGWKATNNALINLTITSFGVTVLFLNISQIFQQSENLKTSQDLYINYVALQNEFLSSLATEQLMVEGKSDPLGRLEVYKRLIHLADHRLKELSLIRLGFDPSPILDIKSRVDSAIGLGSLGSSPLSPTPTKPVKAEPKK
jgi:hypothetical protein